MRITSLHLASTAALVAFSGLPSAAVAVSVVYEYPVPSPASHPGGIGWGGNGVVWFTEFDANKIASIDLHGRITEVELPTPSSGPEAVMSQPDVYGAAVFTESEANKIGRISLDGKLKEFEIPTPNAGPRGLAAPDNFAIWFTEFNVDRIGRLTWDGRFSEFPLTAGSHPLGIAAGSFGNTGNVNVWFTEFGANKIGRLAPGSGRTLGGLSEFVIPTPDSGPTGIVGAQNGQFAPFAMWFTEFNANKIGRITEDGHIDEFTIPTPDSGPVGITFDLGGTTGGGLWFTESRANKIARLDPDGTIVEFPLPTPNSGPTAIFEGWFIESNANKVGRLAPDWLVAVAAGHAASWDTQFSFANGRDQSVTATVGLRPPRICGVCVYQSKPVTLPGNGSGGISASEITGFEGFDTFIVTTPFGPDDDLPTARVRILNRNRPSQAADIPALRLSTLRKLDPSVLTFPGASRGSGKHSNLVLAEVSEEGAELSLSVEAHSAAGDLIGTTQSVSLGVSQTIELFDILGMLGVSSLDEGQIRVTRVSGTGLLWGVLATSSEDGSLTTSSGLNP